MHQLALQEVTAGRGRSGCEESYGNGYGASGGKKGSF